MMEDPCLISTPSIERFFFDSKKNLETLPILGTSALEQFLEQESERMRMSPDSTMAEGTVSTSGAESLRSECGSSIGDQVPDSTTSDLYYNSDAFDSESSVCSLAELASSQPPPPKVYTKKNSKKSKKAGDTLLKCNQCNYTTRFKEHLTSHMNTHADTRNYMCNHCGLTFKWSHSLKRHQRTHSEFGIPRYSCHFCPKTFGRKDHLTIHESLHQDSGSTYPCSECSMSFKNKKTLAGHMKTHTSEKAFKCDKCDSEFTRKASLNRHVKAAHDGEFIACELCPETFRYRNSLQDHIKAAHNEGRREFRCDLCGVEFAVKAYLSKHMATCRNRAEGRSFACSLCSKSFPTKRHLHDHNKRKHPQEVISNSPSQSTSSQRSSPSAQPPPIVQPPPSYQTYDSSNYYYNDNHLMGNDLPLPQVSAPSSVIMDEDHNVGSLLRLVYSCPDQLEQNEYHANHQSNRHVTQHSVVPDLMDCYQPPILDGISALDYL